MFARSSLIAAGFAIGLATLVPGKAEAHRRWLLPSATVLSGDSGLVTVDGASSNGLFIFEHHAMQLDDLKVTGPDGQPVEPKIIGAGQYRSTFDVPLKQQGTYRIAVASDGAMGFYELNGERQRIRGKTVAEAQAAVPAGATNVRITESSQRVETFTTLGEPNDVALKAAGRGLEMVPVTHPNDLAAGEPAQVQFLLDGKPAAGLEVEFVEGGTRYRDDAGIKTLTTDADGKVELNAARPGMYYIETSASSGEGDGAAAPQRRASYTAVLEFLPL